MYFPNFFIILHNAMESSGENEIRSTVYYSGEYSFNLGENDLKGN